MTLDLYAFLTTEPNDVVGPIHQEATPVILTTQDEIETWLTAPWEEAKALQRPLRSLAETSSATAEVGQHGAADATGPAVMDEEPPIGLPEPPRARAGLYIHYCDHEGCKEWGCFGYADRYGTLWVCGEHRGDAGDAPIPASLLHDP